MIERWCSWHEPFPIMLQHYGDGRKKITRTHGICAECLARVQTERKGGSSEKVPTGAASCEEVGGRASLLCILSEDERKRFMRWNDGVGKGK